MKKNLLSLVAVIVWIMLLVFLTGCANNDTNKNSITNSITETEQIQDEQEGLEKDSEKSKAGKTFKVGNYTLKYGRYSDGNVMVVNIKEDGTLYLNAVEQEYTIEGDTIKLKNIDLKVTSNEGFDHIVNGKVLTSYTYSELN